MFKLVIPFLITGILSSSTLEPVYLNNNLENNIHVKDGTLRATVTIAKDLPSEFYGTWSIETLIIESDAPELISRKGSEIWAFVKNKDTITLSNPVTQASASITVNQVIGKRAIFTREKISEKLKEIETADISIDDKGFSGTDTIILHQYHKGKYIKTNTIKYQVVGNKISGPTLKDIFAL